MPTTLLNVISRLNIGGISPYLIPLTPLLRARGYNALLAAGGLSAGEGDMSYLAAQIGLAPLEVPSLGREVNPLRDLRTVRELYALFRARRPTIVHTHTAKAGFAGRLAARLARVPYVFHSYHGHTFRGYFGPVKTRFYLALEQFGALLSTRVVAVSENVRRELADVHHLAPPRKVEVVIPGYDLSALYALQRDEQTGVFRAAHGIAPDAPLVGMVGRLVPIKNHALFVRAVQIVHAALPAARFAIIGDGERRSAVESEVAARGLADCVRFTGWQRDLPAIYRDLNALVLCSKNEGLPSSVIEALVTGVPVVGTAVGGVVDLLADGRGALVPSEDAESLAAAMLATLRDPATARARAEAGRAEAFARYHIVPAAERIDAFYRQIIAL